MIRRARELVGESQTTFGARFGVDQSTYSRWESEGPPNRGPGRMALQREVDAIFAEHGAQPAEGQS